MSAPRLAFLLAFFLLASSAHSQPDPVADKLREMMMATYNEQGKGDFFAARKKAEAWLAYARKKRGANHTDTSMALQATAGVYAVTGAHRKAEALYREMLDSAEKLHGAESQEVATAIDSLASSFWGQQRLDEAEALFARSLKIYRKIHGESAIFASFIGRQAAFLMSRYMFAAAEQLYFEQERLLKKFDPDGTQALTVRLSLGVLYGRQGEYKKADKAFTVLLDGYEKKFGKDDTVQVPPMMQSIATMYAMWGQNKRALELYAKSEDAYRRQLDAQRADPKTYPGAISGTQLILANILRRQGKTEEATQMYENVLAEQEKLYGVGSFQASGAIYPLAELYRDSGDLKNARRLLKAWAKSYEKTFGGFSAITPLIFLGDLERVAGNFTEAKRLATRVRDAAAKTYGKGHPTTQLYGETIAINELGLGAPKRALAILQSSYASEKKAIALILASGTENDNRTYLNERRHQMHVAISLHSQYLPKDKKAIRLGLDTVLVHKGRILDASAASVGSLRQHLSKEDLALLDELAASRSELARLVVAGPAAAGGDDAAYAKEIARLESDVRKLEGRVRSRSAVFRAREQPIEIGAIQKAIPKDASLVEIVSYRRIDPRAKQMIPEAGDRYGAYVLTSKGDPSFVDLGATKRIDEAVDKLRKELSSAAGSDYEKIGKQLSNLVFAPIEPLLGKRKLVLLAPDGALNLLPFAALVDDGGAFLVERYSFTYLSSGRDLLRLSVKIGSKQNPVIFADPSFDDSGKAADKGKTRGLTVRALRSIKWKKLPGTAREAKAIVKLIDDASLYDGDKATESKLKEVSAPRILHLATHGFFLPGDEAPPPEDGGIALPGTMRSAATSVGSGQDNPLLRSGLALAGANKLSSGSEDGVLTALEASGLDLWGTKLVVLSACETGVGEISAGEGVYGLRRALVMAGAESMLMSLWQVDDEATKDLMIGYYGRLRDGKGRSDALRLIQLNMLRSEDHKHPYYWASFIPSGAWSPMNK